MFDINNEPTENKITIVVNKMDKYEIVKFNEEIFPSPRLPTIEWGKRWIFDPKINVNIPELKFTLYWWEDLAVRYLIYNFDMTIKCEEVIEGS